MLHQTARLWGCKVTLVAFVWLFSTVSFQMCPQIACLRHIHIGCIRLIFPHCVFSNVSSNCRPERMHSHIGCICLSFPHCVFSNFSPNHLSELMQSHIGNTCLAFHQCALSNDSSNGLYKKTNTHIDCICLIWLHCLSLNSFWFSYWQGFVTVCCALPKCLLQTEGKFYFCSQINQDTNFPRHTFTFSQLGDTWNWSVDVWASFPK